VLYRITSALVVLASCVPCQGGQYSLVHDGRSAYAIYASANAPSSVKQAANELQRYINKASGVELPGHIFMPQEDFLRHGEFLSRVRKPAKQVSVSAPESCVGGPSERRGWIPAAAGIRGRTRLRG